MLTEEVADIIIPLHVITGSDHTSGFYGHGKKKVLKVLEKVTTNPEARELLGADVTCGQARASKWHKLKTKSTIPLPLDDDSLNLHIERANFIAYCQLHYNLFEHPSPIGHGWELVNGKCRPVRHTLPALPQQLTLHDCPDESSDDERKIQVDLPDPLSNFPETPPSCSLDPSCSMDITHANVKHPIGRTSCNCHT
ncbi:hypothetical protein SKAU_G00143620 [Synaphobranchus kaupii]|uniref:Uncharacterized protein n=1 Tax=Synaphobranchus kaupii TaxID=118154 RepID=A0A9Q1FSP0_SYNKA|nr:hypothetical protein SKAU_G00143620 [Synaphobranchus kaupii]